VSLYSRVRRRLELEGVRTVTTKIERRGAECGESGAKHVQQTGAFCSRPADRPERHSRAEEENEKQLSYTPVDEDTPLPSSLYSRTRVTNRTHRSPAEGTLRGGVAAVRGSRAYDLAYRITSEILAGDAWIVQNDDDATTLAAELKPHGADCPIFTTAEVTALQGLPPCAIRAVARAKCVLGGRLLPIRALEPADEFPEETDNRSSSMQSTRRTSSCRPGKTADFRPEIRGPERA
jgi:hypothetical protein